MDNSRADDEYLTKSATNAVVVAEIIKILPLQFTDTRPY